MEYEADVRSRICRVLGNQIGLGSSDGRGVNARAKLLCRAIAASGQCGFPQTKSLDTFDFNAQSSLNKALIVELARDELD